MECEGLRAQFLKCFDGEHRLEQEGLPTRGCPLYIAGEMMIIFETLACDVFDCLCFCCAGSSVDVGRVVSSSYHPSFPTSVALLRVAEVTSFIRVGTIFS
jgi:hypothetical protein